MHETSDLPEPQQHPMLARFYDWSKQRPAQRSSSLANKTRQHDKTPHPENSYVTLRSH